MKIRLFICASAIAVATVSPTFGKEFVFGSWAPHNHGSNYALEPLFKSVQEKSKGEMTWKFVPGGQIVNPRSTGQALRDNLIDAGLILPTVYTKELAANNVIYNLLGFGTDTAAIAGATIETIMLNCPRCLDEYKNMGAVFLAGYGPTPYRLLCAKPVKGSDDIKGEKIQSLGTAARIIKALGATPVTLSPSDSIPGLQRGALSCVHGPYVWARIYGLDVIRSIFDAPLGTPRAFGLFVMSRTTWKSLPADQKKLLWAEMPKATAAATIRGHIVEDLNAIEDAKKHGITIVPVGDALKPVMEAFNAEEKNAVAAEGRTLGVKDPEQLIEKHLELLKKWENLTKDIGQDQDKFAALLRSEVYSKLDPEKW
jgi:TRAP-type C4-dicarboxylate transport system substrate-binding protein